MFCYLDYRCYFGANGQNHIHFWFIQVLENSMAWHFLPFISPSSKVEFVYSPCCRRSKSKCSSSRQVIAWTSQRLLNSEIQSLSKPSYSSQRLLRVLHLVKTSIRVVENLPQRKLWVWAANDARFHPPNFLVFSLELFVAQCILAKSGIGYSG